VIDSAAGEMGVKLKADLVRESGKGTIEIKPAAKKVKR